MKPQTTNLIAVFFKTVFYSVLIIAICFFLACFTLSCASVYKPCQSGEKICTVIKKDCDKATYCDFTCVTLFSNEKIYLSGFSTDANLKDTLNVVIREDGFNYFKKGN